MPHFETFRRGGSATAEPPHVTVLKRGALSINRAAFQALGSPTFVDLLYDAQESIIGLRTAQRESETAQRVRPTSGRGPVLISAMAFVKFHRLDVSVTKRWPAYLDGGVLCIDLRTDGVPVTSNRAATGRVEL
jgi:hypothetical protein